MEQVEAAKKALARRGDAGATPRTVTTGYHSGEWSGHSALESPSGCRGANSRGEEGRAAGRDCSGPSKQKMMMTVRTRADDRAKETATDWIHSGVSISRTGRWIGIQGEDEAAGNRLRDWVG